MSEQTGTISITFCDQGENHVGMQTIGKLAETGYSGDQMNAFQQFFESQNYQTELIQLNTIETMPYASLLIVKNYLSPEENVSMMSELVSLVWDKKAKMYGRVINKKARYNLCIADFDQEPDYDSGKGRIYKWGSPSLTRLSSVHDSLLSLDPMLGVAEMNYYYDVEKCNIGYHGDAERKRVVCLRVGQSIPLKYRWYNKGSPTTQELSRVINGGDLYIMNGHCVTLLENMCDIFVFVRRYFSRSMFEKIQT